MLGIPFERQLLSVFSNAEEMRAFNPLVRVPALVLDDGECLIDSAAILDHLDETVGPERALMPAGGKARRDALQKIALATGVSDKAIAITYERRKPAAKIDETWIARCRGQQEAALAELERRFAAAKPDGARLMQPEITVATMLGYLRLRQPETPPRRPLSGARGAIRPGRGAPGLQSLPADAQGDRRIAARGPGRAFALAG